jgi:2-methylcitrate dehydratase PrpD
VTYTEELSRFITDARIEDFPSDVIEVARKCALDWIGVTLGAVGDPAVELLKDIVLEMGGNEQASVLGYGSRVTMANAALVNGMMAHTLDYDDAHSGVRTHPSAPLVSAILAAGEYLGCSGKDLVEAFVVGCEVTLRVGYALGKTYYEKGWHATSILGRFGAAAGASRLFGLSAGQASMALGLAATQAGGLRDAFGTMTKPFHSGKAAMDGLLSALLAQKGFTAPVNILDPGSGFARLFSPDYEPDRLLRGLGNDFETLGVNFKPYAACLLVHPVIDGLIRLREQNGLDPGAIDEIHLSIAPLNLQVTDDPVPMDGLQAKFSLQMAAALALTYGRATESLFTDEMVHEPRITSLMGKVKAFADDALSETEATINVVLQDGQDYSIHIDTPKGDPRNPLTFEEIAEKARDLTATVLSDRIFDEVIDLTDHLSELDTIVTLVHLCCPDRR